MAAVTAITAATPHTFTVDKDAQPRPIWRRTRGDARIRAAATLGVYVWACLRFPEGDLMMQFMLVAVVVSVFVSGGSVAAQSRSVRSPAVELSEWDTSTLLRLRDLLEAEIARRGASGDLAALRDRLQPGATPPRAGGAPAVPDASVGLGRSRSAVRTWGGVGLAVGGLALVRQRCDGVRFDDTCLGTPTWWGGSTAAGLGVSAVGILLATVWADVPVAASADFGPGRAGVGGVVRW